MATQFEVLVQKLDQLFAEVQLIREVLEDSDVILGEATLDLGRMMPEEVATPVAPRQMNRRQVEVSAMDGSKVMVDWTDLDPRVVEAIRIATERGLQYDLYQDPSGRVRISVDAEVAHIITKNETFQPPVPTVTKLDEGMEDLLP